MIFMEAAAPLIHVRSGDEGTDRTRIFNRLLVHRAV
jgi:hypothetical protein